VGDRIGISPPLGQHDMSQLLQARRTAPARSQWASSLCMVTQGAL
jgi:hypothetical protein